LKLIRGDTAKIQDEILKMKNSLLGGESMKRHLFPAIILTAAVLLPVSLKASVPDKVIVWGSNSYGQCNVPDLNVAIKAVSGGFYHNLGLKQNGSITCWGTNTYGLCDVPSPNSDFNAISAGFYHNLGLKLNGSIVGWGDNSIGQCDVPEPNTGFSAVSVGLLHSLALKQDGSVVAWGWNGYGQCDVPVPNTGFIAVAAGWFHSVGLKQNGSIVVWGDNSEGQRNVPSPNSGFIAIVAGGYHNLALKSDGSVVAWGANWDGQCSVPSPNSNFVKIAAGSYHSIGLKSNSEIKAWGYNDYNQCRVPTIDYVTVSSVAAGGYNSMAVFQPTEYLGDVDYSEVYQQLEGFGAAGAWYENWLTAHPQKTTLYDILFRDLGLDIYRVRNCYGFDSGYINNTKEIVQAAKALNPSLKILNCAWSPPAYLKSNNDTNSYPLPGTLKKDANDFNNSAPYYYVYKAYANWWADSLAAFESNSIHTDYMSIQNEADFETTYESCKFLPTETSSYAGYDKAFEAVYQKLNSAMGPNMPKMLAPETIGFGGAQAYINSLIDVNHVYGYAHHLYSDGDYDYPDSFVPGMQNFASLNSYKPLLQTEYAKLTGTTSDFDAAMNMARHIHNSLVYEGVCSYFYWDLFWGVDGGLVTFPTYGSSSYIINPTYYVFKHYSKFTDPGWYLVGSSINSGNLRITAFKSPDNTKLTLVVLNKSNALDVYILLSLAGFNSAASAVYRSSATEHWAYMGTFNPSQHLRCPKQSITTISLSRGELNNCADVQNAGLRLAADITGNCYVNYEDLDAFVDRWLDTGCNAGNNYCANADIDNLGSVNMFDFSTLGRQWMSCNDPLNPDCL
jgi:O-glycosyl hydrolase